MSINEMLYENTKSIEFINKILRKNLALQIANGDVKYKLDINDDKKLKEEITLVYKDKVNGMNKEEFFKFLSNFSNTFLINENLRKEEIYKMPYFMDYLIDNIKNNDFNNMFFRELDPKLFKGHRMQLNASLKTNINENLEIINMLPNKEYKDIYIESYLNKINKICESNHSYSIDEVLTKIIGKENIDVFLKSKLSENSVLMNIKTLDVLTKELGLNEEEIYNLYKKRFDNNDIDEMKNLDNVLNKDVTYKEYIFKTLSNIEYKIYDEKLYEQLKDVYKSINDKRLTEVQKLALEDKTLKELDLNYPNLDKKFLGEREYKYSNFSEKILLKDYNEVKDMENIWAREIAFKETNEKINKLEFER